MIGKLILITLVQMVLSRSVFQHSSSTKSEKCPPSLSRGWGDSLDWIQTYEEALYRARTNNKPLMIIHHSESCPKSKALKEAFASHDEIQTMAQEHFNMLNLVFETNDHNIFPDGQYMPRILFVDPSLTVRTEITGSHENQKYKYEDKEIEILHENMKKALKLLRFDL
ncbi:anterior gradient protein 3-like isoform X2 [Erpetoichthys calabaricus]|uniref:Anterior gradient 2, protein disulphide isomerase family member n=1 Tax=Erpetoichthys calabaricus TaxID=27687 RepID=A0A8C4SL50_ERPCA|nr:anterior gradient protein 3-like isoform X2 [Erpetoichthys calabaricus]